MAQGKFKLFAVTTAFFAIFAIIFFALSVTSIEKFRAQKKRAHHLEQKILAGKKEMMKVPEVIGKLRVADKTNNELTSEVADLKEANEEMETELTDLQKELTTVTIAKAVLDVERAGYTKNLVEARQAVEELRQQLSTHDGGTNIDKINFNEQSPIETELCESAEEVSSNHAGEDPSGLQNSLASMQKILHSPQFLFLRPEERFEKLNSLITKAKEQSQAKSEINQLIKEFAEKVSSAESTMSEILASLDEAQTKL